MHWTQPQQLALFVGGDTKWTPKAVTSRGMLRDLTGPIGVHVMVRTEKTSVCLSLCYISSLTWQLRLAVMMCHIPGNLFLRNLFTTLSADISPQMSLFIPVSYWGQALRWWHCSLIHVHLLLQQWHLQSLRLECNTCDLDLLQTILTLDMLQAQHR